MTENASRLSGNYTEKFRFVSRELSPELFRVVRFSGTEGLHSLFSFVIELVSTDNAVDTEKLLHSPAELTILRDKNEPVVFNGYPSRVEQGGTFNGYTYYTVELRPSFWKLTKIIQSRVFLEQNLQETIKELLISQKFFAFANEFTFTRTDYPKPEFAMQYEESIYDYICWRLEEQGSYFYIDQKTGFDTLVFADSPQSHKALATTPTLFYSPASGLEGSHVPEVITSFILRQTPVPRQVVIRSYDWKKPEKPIVGIAEVSSLGLGDVYLTNENVSSDADAERLAKIRAEQLLAGQRAYYGQSAAPTLRPGYTFTLDRHYSPTFNRGYLVTSVTHEGSQEAFLSLGLGIPMHGVTDHLFYRNTFTCIPDDTTFRPARLAPRNRIPGVIRAFIDGSGSGARPEMDGYGRYKILFPFDVSGRKKGKASCWIRMAQQQVGNNSGTSFPLLPGTEVTVGFLDGNPDLPIITGALANGETGARTGGGNVNASGIRTAGGNQITFNDTDTHQGIAITTPNGHGLTITSGSMSSSAEVADSVLKGCSTIGSDIAGLGKNFATSFKITQLASPPTTLKVSQLTLSVVLKSIGNILSSLSSKASDLEGGDNITTKWGLQFGADGAKILAQITDMIIGGVITAKSPAINYGASLIAGEKQGRMQVQVLPKKRELITSLITWIVGRAISAGTDIAAGAVEANPTYYADADYINNLNAARKTLYTFNSTRYKDYETDLKNLNWENKKSHCSDKTTLVSQLDMEIGILKELQTSLSLYNTYVQRIASLTQLQAETETKLKASKTDAEQKAFQAQLDDINTQLSSLKNMRSNLVSLAKSVTPASEATTDDAAVKAAQTFTTDNIEKLTKAKTNLEKAWSTFCDNKADNSTYYNSVRCSAIHQALTSTAADLIPEMASIALLFVAACKRTRTTSRLGGVLLNAKDANVNITAKLPVSVHSGEGVLFNTHVSNDAASTNIKHYFDEFETWGCPGKTKDINTAATLPEVLHADWKQFLSVPDNVFTDNANTNCTAAQMRTNNKFVATTTDLAYTEAKYGLERFQRERVSIAKKQIIQNGSATLLLNESKGQEKGGITLSARKTNASENYASANHHILLEFGGDKANGCYSNLALTSTQAVMAFDPATAANRAVLTLQNKAASLSACDGASKSAVNLSDQLAQMIHGNDTFVSCSSDTVTLKGAKVVAGDITISGHEIKGSAGGILDFSGGAIKITGSAVTTKTDSLRQSGEKIEQNISKALQELSQQLEQHSTAIAKLGDTLEKK